MRKCKACGRDFASTNPNDEICYPCNNALKRLNGYAVPVVRCKDCKHRYSPNNPKCKPFCTKQFGMDARDEDFCFYGERKDNG